MVRERKRLVSIDDPIKHHESHARQCKFGTECLRLNLFHLELKFLGRKRTIRNRFFFLFFLYGVRVGGYFYFFFFLFFLCLKTVRCTVPCGYKTVGINLECRDKKRERNEERRTEEREKEGEEGKEFCMRRDDRTDGSGRFRVELVGWNAHVGRRRLSQRVGSRVEELERRSSRGRGRCVVSHTHLVTLLIKIKQKSIH